MPLQAIEPQRLYQQVADQLADLIRNGEFAVGQRLPPERDLARMLGVSRPIVREAMVALEIAGLVEVRTGSGAYVRPPIKLGDEPGRPPEPGAAVDVGPSPFDLIAARKVIEAETAALAAGRASASEVARIDATVRAMRAAIRSGREHREADRAFHTSIAAATGNSVLAAIVEELWLGMYQPVFIRLSARIGLPTKQTTAIDEHIAIADAIRRHDQSGAREAMLHHLSVVEEVMMSDDES